MYKRQTIECVVRAHVARRDQESRRYNDAQKDVGGVVAFKAEETSIGRLEARDKIRVGAIEQFNSDVRQAGLVCLLNTVLIQVVPDGATNGSG